MAAVALLLLVPRATRADGTVTTADLLRTLGETNPKLVRTLRDGFELDKDAVGASIGAAINRGLGGTRIGPYTVHGRLRRSPGAESLVITLNTELTFLDAEGHKTAKVAAAARVKESFSSFQVEVAPKPGPQ
jgi:hypothetical protein